MSNAVVKPQTHEYKNFRGVDFSSRPDEVIFYRSPDALNMWKNYKNSSGGNVETRPDVELIKEFDDVIYGMAFYDVDGSKHRIVHSGNKLYDNDNVIYENMAKNESVFFVYDDILYFLDGEKYLQYDKNEVKEVEPYIPRTTMSKDPAGGGVVDDAVNLITDYRINSFVSDGTAKDYVLDVQNIVADSVEAWINDSKVTNFSVNATDGIITFNTAPEIPLTDGQDNVYIKFKKTTDNKQLITKCTMVTLFDSRVFVSGNPDKPNMAWNCDYTNELTGFSDRVNTPIYFPDNCYYAEGFDQASVRGFAVGNNALWAFKETNSNGTTVYYHNPVTIDVADTVEKGYSPTPSSISVGCVGRPINFNDDLVFFSERGMEAISGDVTTEQTLAHRSTLVDNKMTSLDGYKDMILEKWKNYLLVFIGNKVFLADSKSRSQINNDIQYEWYYWELEENGKELNIRGATADDEVLYLYSDKKLYTLTKTDTNIMSYWCTLADEFNAPQYQKTTNKRGCVADVEGSSINVYAKTDANKFEKINTYKNVKGYIVPRIKKKKWKSIQIKFESSKPFNLYSCTLEAYVGSYIKR